jgi:hypothetical protein
MKISADEKHGLFESTFTTQKIVHAIYQYINLWRIQ